MSREKLNELIEFVREGDEVYVESWSRLSRTVSDLLKIFEMFDRKKVRLYSVKEQYDTSVLIKSRNNNQRLFYL